MSKLVSFPDAESMAAALRPDIVAAGERCGLPVEDVRVGMDRVTGTFWVALKIQGLERRWQLPPGGEDVMASIDADLKALALSIEEQGS